MIDPEIRPPPSPLTVTIPAGSTAQKVLEIVANTQASDPNYRFSATYYGNLEGYFIDKLWGVPNVNDPQNKLFWIYSFKLPRGATIEPEVAISQFIIPESGELILQYQQSNTEHAQLKHLKAMQST